MTESEKDNSLGESRTDIEILVDAIHLGIEDAKKAEELRFLGSILKPKDTVRLNEQAAEDFKARGIQAAADVMRAANVNLYTEASPPRRELKVTYDKSNNVSFNGMPAISLSRRMKSVNAQLGMEETEGNAIRLELMKVMAANPNKAFLRLELWNALCPGEEFNRPLWDTHIMPFLQDPPKADGLPLVHAVKIYPRVVRYIWGNFDATFESYDGSLEVADEPIFTFEDGTGVASKTGALLHMMSRANANNPIMNDEFLALYSEDELAEIGYPLREHLRRTVSGVRNYYFDGRDTEWVIWRVKTDVRDPDTGHRQSGYFMEKQLSIYEAGTLCQFLALHDNLMDKRGIAKPSATLLQALQEAMIIDDTPFEAPGSIELKERRRESFEKFIRLLSNKSQMDNFIKNVSEKDSNDPRLDALQYFSEVVSNGGERAVRELLTSEYAKAKRRLFHSDKKEGVRLVSEP